MRRKGTNFVPYAIAVVASIGLAIVLGTNRETNPTYKQPNQLSLSTPASPREQTEPDSADPRTETTSVPAFSALVSSEYQVESPRQEFEQHIELAKEGNTTSMIRVAEAIRNCVLISSASWSEFTQTDLYQSGSFPREMEEDFQRAFDSLGPDCTYVNSQIPKKQRDRLTWANYWYYQAANAGDPIAKLELSLQQPPQPEQKANLQRLLNDAYETGDYRAYYYAANFYANVIEHDPRQITTRMWSYLGCVGQPTCSPEAMRAHLAVEFVPADVELIVATAEYISDARPPIDFVEEPTIFDLADSTP